MGLPWIQTWTWTLCVFSSWMCGGQALAKPMYMVATPAIIEAGAETKFCASLLQPNETLSLTVTLLAQETRTVLFTKTSSEEFHTCSVFKAPVLKKEKVQKLEVVVQGDTFYSREERIVLIRAYEPMTFVQTDKPVYLPGQTVHFRVVTLDSKLRPASRLYSLIEIQDSLRNRIGQWLNTTSSGKILQLSYALNSEAREGMYDLTVWSGAVSVHHSFRVKKYVLPKFDVKLIVADKVSIAQDELTTLVCARYTYGQPVPAKVKVEACLELDHYYSGDSEEQGLLSDWFPCHTVNKQTDTKGCVIVTVPTSAMFVRTKHLRNLIIKSEAEEEGTGISRHEQKVVRISYSIGKLSFIDTPKFYEKGAHLEGKVRAVHYNDTPISEMELYLFIDNWPPQLLLNLTTDSDGVAGFSLSTDAFRGVARLRVSDSPTNVLNTFHTPHFDLGEYTVSLLEPPAPDTKTLSTLVVKQNKKLLPCDQEQEIFIQYTLVGQEQGVAYIMYLVLSKGNIVMQGSKQIEVADELVSEGQVSFKVTVNGHVAPIIQVVAYAILPDEAVIASSAKFTTEKCFHNKVSLEFSPSSAVPGEETSMRLTARPDSLCGVSAVDQSVHIEEPGKKLNADQIFRLLPVTDAPYIPYEVRDPAQCVHVRRKRYVLPNRDDIDDAHKVFQDAGIKMATNLIVRIPLCLKFKGRRYTFNPYDNEMEYPMIQRSEVHHRLGAPGFGSAPPMSSAPGLAPTVTVRTVFPETWIWDLVEVGESGTKDVAVTVPDTITTWETEAFCLSPQGFGLAPPTKMTVFQPFFLELTLPYSIIRGEHFELKATVFNYLHSCIMISVVPPSSPDFTLTPLSGDQYTSCLCGSERKTLSWTMSPSVLGVVKVTVLAEAVTSHLSCDNEVVSVPERGRIDVVTRSLIVKAEGTEKTETHNWLLCPKGEALTEELELQLPEDVIPGSARASLSVLGDMMGRALKNLDGLLQMPYGCGEQNMALLAPNIYILQYLKTTQQLTPTIQEKATSFLTSGYQRQLNYKHSDGSYSTFGRGSGNTWLTAFVLRSFAKAQSFIYIDPSIIKESKSWLDEHQSEDGCFQPLGKLFNNRMKGGVSDAVTLSAYITAAFLEMGTSVDDVVVKKSLSCLKGSTSDLSNTYTTALMAYVFTLAGDMETRDRLLQQLHAVSIKEGNLLHWTQTAEDTSASLSVEISAYVLLAKLSASPTAEDLGYASKIVRWLATQQNYYGGFSSTQDTVVALQALALHATLVFSPDGSGTVKVQAPGEELLFEVNQNNKLLYQEKSLREVTGKFSLEAKGTVCVSMQISLHYNIPTPTDFTTLSIEVQPEAVCTSRPHRLSLKLKLLYSGNEVTTNMVILDIKILSGFAPDPESLEQLKRSMLVDRVERKQDHVLVYIEMLPKGVKLDKSLELIQELPVQNLKPAVVRIYDYYQPRDQAETQYTFSCAAA